MSDENSDNDGTGDDSEVLQKKRKIHETGTTCNKSVVCNYARSSLHRRCKLVLKDTGVSFFEIQQKLNSQPKTKRKILPKLPPEIWIKIFSFIVAERQFPFMIRAPLVCKQWYDLCLSPSLWTYVWVPYGGYYWMRRTDVFLEWLAKNRLAPCKEIDLRGWDVTHHGIKALTENCPKLQALNVSYCTKLSTDVAIQLVVNCPFITTLDFSHTCNDLVSVTPMTKIIEHYNAQLLSLNLCGNLIYGFHRIMDALCEFCPNLEVLSINYCRVDIFTLDIERLQRNLTNLRTLNMGYVLASSVNVEDRPAFLSPGFKSLEDLCIGVGSPCDNRLPLPINNKFIERMVMSSKQLKSLDIRGCEHFSVRTLLRLPCPHLEKLMMGVRVIDDPLGLPDVLKQWRHSLTDLILSYSSFQLDDLQAAILGLVGEENPILERVELENMSIHLDLVQAISNNCPKLRTVNFQKCLTLPKKLRRFFDFRKIHHFHRILQIVMKNQC